MVIETKEQYSALLDIIKNKDVSISFIRDDFRTHPCESNLIAASLWFENQSYDIIFNHSETFEVLDYKQLDCVKRFWTDDAKQFYHLFGFDNVIDVSLGSWVENKDISNIEPDNIFWLTYRNHKSMRSLNYVVPLTKIIEFTRIKLIEIDKMKERLSVNKPFLTYNKRALELAKI